jgi:Holliday junction resolvase RusA-like endonuclease
MKLIIPGKPMGKQRPKFGKGFTYTPEKTVSYENYVKELFIIQGEKMQEGALKADITAYFEIPKSKSKKDKELKKKAIIRPCSKPDTDNIGKIILDSLNGIAYQDDKQIVELRVRKYYSEEPKVILELEEVL